MTSKHHISFYFFTLLPFQVLFTFLLFYLFTFNCRAALTPQEADKIINSKLIRESDCPRYAEALEALARSNGHKSRMPEYCATALENYAWVLIHNGQLDLAKQVLNEALVYVQPADTATRYKIYSAFGDCYLKTGNAAKAWGILQKLYDYHKRKRMTYEQMLDMKNYGAYYARTGKPGQALACYRRAWQLAQKCRQWVYACIIKNDIAAILIDHNERIASLRENLGYELAHDLPQMMPTTHFNLAKVYAEAQKYDEALAEINAATKGINESTYFLDSTDVARLLGDIYSARQNFELASYYYLETVRLTTAKAEVNNSRIANESNMVATLIAWCRDNVVMKPGGTFELKTDKEHLSGWQTAGIGASLIVIIASILLARRSNRLRRETTEKFNEYRNRQDAREKDMENTIGYLQLFYNNQNVLLNKIHALIRQVSGRDAENNTKLRNIAQFIQASKLEEMKSEYTDRQQKKDEDFVARLTRLYPNLTETEKLTALYLWRGLSTHEICILTGNQPRSVNMSRYRLRKSMSLGSDDDLTKHLRNI